jgi:hypothetical protein
VSPLAERPTTANMNNVGVQIEVIRSDGLFVLGETRPLDLWSWQMSAEGSEGIGPAFVYSAGRRLVPVGKSRPWGDNADHGNGTMFQPTPRAHYRLVVHVTRPAAEARYFTVRLKAISSSEIGSL